MISNKEGKILAAFLTLDDSRNEREKNKKMQGDFQQGKKERATTRGEKEKHFRRCHEAGQVDWGRGSTSRKKKKSGRTRPEAK